MERTKEALQELESKVTGQPAPERQTKADYIEEIAKNFNPGGGATLYRHTLVIKATDPLNTYSEGYTFGLSFVASDDTAITTLDELKAIFGKDIPCSGFAQGEGGIGTLAYGITFSTYDQKYMTSIIGVIANTATTILDLNELGTATVKDTVTNA